jgi:hypothetical protein
MRCTNSLNALGFNPCAYTVISWLQSLLSKINLYRYNEEGCYFRRHRDNERLAGCFGTLVIQLPSSFTGGELTVNYPADPADLAQQDKSTGGESTKATPSSAMRFSVQGNDATEEMRAFFFYADYYHEVEEITSGSRLALVYTLYHLDVDEFAIAAAAAAAAESAASGGYLNHRVAITGLVSRSDLNGRNGFACE